MLSSKIRIIFRVDANGKVGMGHLMRCIALSEGIRKKVNCKITFLAKNSDIVIEKVSKYGYNLETRLPKEFVDIVVTDVPGIDQYYLLKLKEKTKLLVSIDDSTRTQFPADIVVRGSIVPELRSCKRDSQSQFLLGPNFMILSKEFQKFNKRKKKINSRVKSILITMGGSDINNLTPKIMAALDELSNITKIVVVGPVFKHIDKLRLNKNYNLKYDVSNMAELMFSSDIAIAGGGMTLYELVSVGTPGIILCQTKYQLLEANYFEKRGIVTNLGLGQTVTKEVIMSAVETLLKDTEKRGKMSSTGKKVIDGKGLDRVVTAILEAL
jgi:spore coat polysaccharide biosynthesis predicted glycosyltransferase SpsG